MASISVQVTWMDGRRETYTRVEKANLDKEGRNLLVYERGVLTMVIPLGNVRLVEYT